MKCLSCEEDVIEDWRHIRECLGLKESWMNIHKDMVEYMDILLRKILSSKKDFPSPDIMRRIISKVLGAHPESLTFLNFKRYAGEVKFHITSSRYLRQELRLSDLEITNVSSRLLLHFIRLFKIHIWNPRCLSFKDWEKDHDIILTHTNTRSPHRRNNKRTPSHIINNTPRDDIIVYDDIDPITSPFRLHDRHIYTRLERRIEALPRTWRIIQDYVENNLLPPWISKSSKYFNGKIKLIEEWIT